MVLSTIPRLVIDTLAVTAMVTIVLIILTLGQNPQAILPILGMFAIAAIRLMPSAARIANALASLRFHYAATEIVYNELRATAGDRAAVARGAAVRAACSALPFERSIVLDHLSYRYPAIPQPAIDKVSLEIPKGHWGSLQIRRHHLGSASALCLLLVIQTEIADDLPNQLRALDDLNIGLAGGLDRGRLSHREIEKFLACALSIDLDHLLRPYEHKGRSHVLLREQKGEGVSSNRGDDAQRDNHPQAPTQHVEDWNVFHHCARPPVRRC
jgi:hypothetical protein